MSAAARILSRAERFCWRADMFVSISPFGCINGVQPTPFNTPVHETGDVQGGRDNADAVANDLGGDEESVHSQEPSRFGISLLQAQTGSPICTRRIIDTD